MPAKRKNPTSLKKVETQNSQPQTYYQPPPSNQPSNILVILLIIVSFAAGYLFFELRSLKQGSTAGTTQPAQQAAPARPTELKIKKPDASDHWRGSKDARYVLVEYSDLECPFCKQAHPDIKKILDENTDNVAWVFRHFPLSFHPKAQKSGEAVECAADQGGDEAFWKMTDTIYEKMPTLELSGLSDVAVEAGLNGQTLQQCLDTNKNEKKVKDQQSEGATAGVQATPSTVIYDMKTGKTSLIEGALPYEQMKTALETFISENK